MKVEEMVLDKVISVTRITAEVEAQDGSFMERAAKTIAKELLSSGCLIHRAEYDINKQYRKEVISLIVGRRKRYLP